VVGSLNGLWAATAVLGPLAAGLGVEHLSPQTVFGLTEALCVAVLAATIALAWRGRRPASGTPHIRAHYRPAPVAPTTTNPAGAPVPAPRRVPGRGAVAARHMPGPCGKARSRLSRPLTPRALAAPGAHGRHLYQRPGRRVSRRRPHRPPQTG